MRGAFKIISIRGIRLYVHWTFLFLIGWVVLVNARMGNDIIQLSWSVMFILAVFACVALHEFGHALMAARFGIQAKEIVLLPIGGIASIEKFPENPRQELAISIAGRVACHPGRKRQPPSVRNILNNRGRTMPSQVFSQLAILGWLLVPRRRNYVLRYIQYACRFPLYPRAAIR